MRQSLLTVKNYKQLTKIIFVFFLLTACLSCTVRPGKLDTASTFQAKINHVLLSGFNSIHKFYLREPKVPTLVIHGLQGLTNKTTKIELNYKSKLITLAKNNVPVTVYVAPAPHDIRAWSDLASSIIVDMRANSNAIDVLTSEEIYKTVFNSALSKLDNFSKYLTAHEAKTSRANRQGYGGIGVSIIQNQEFLTIREIYPDTPAAESNLKIGDRLVQIDGKSVRGATIPNLIKKLKGPPGSSVVLKITRNQRKLTINLLRRVVIPQTVFSRIIKKSLIIEVRGFNEQTTKNLNHQISDSLKSHNTSLDGIILDLRKNRGGILEQAVGVANLFIDSGIIISTSGRHSAAEQRFIATASDKYINHPLIVLIDQTSASAAEIVAAALQDRGKALIIGSRSYGKGSVQRVRDLPNKGALNLTWAKVYAPSGYPLSRFGVFPTICSVNQKQTPKEVIENINNGAILDAEFGALHGIVGDLNSSSQLNIWEFAKTGMKRSVMG